MKNGFQPLAFSYKYISAIASAVLLVLAFPDFKFSFLAWVALAPLLSVINNQKPHKAFLLSYFSGTLFFLGTIYWLIHVTLPGMIVVALYSGLYFGLFGFLYSYFSQKRSVTDYELMFLAPSAWISLEWVRAHFLTGFGWALLGHSQTNMLPIIQISDITGVYGVSFLIVLVNTALSITLKNMRNRKLDTGFITVALFLVFISTAYGIVRLKNVFTGEKIKIAVVQGNIPQDQKWDSSFRQEIIERYEALTKKASADKPDIIIWPETSVPGFLEGDKELRSRVCGLARSLEVPLLVGTLREDKDSNYYNSASLVLANGDISGTYDKVHLVPFGEYIPFKRALSFVEKFAPVPIGDCESGSSYTTLGFFLERKSSYEGASLKLSKKIKFACLICFEDIFPDLSREFVKRGAGFLVNMTNDAWYKHSSAPDQHAQNSIFRAVENRINVVRAANTGLSCFIDQKGQVIGKLNLYEQGFMTQEIALNRARTFYTTYGDLFVYISMLFFVLYGVKRRWSHEDR